MTLGSPSHTNLNWSVQCTIKFNSIDNNNSKHRNIVKYKINNTIFNNKIFIKHITMYNYSTMVRAMSDGKTTIQLTERTRDRLYKLKFRRTYDQFLNELCDIYEAEEKKSEEMPIL